MQKVLLNIKKVFSIRPVLADEVAGAGAGAQAGAVAGAVGGVDPLAQASQTATNVQTQQQPIYQPQAQPQMLNFEQLISQARTEEKNKLYPEINALKIQVQDLTGKLNDAMVQIGTKEATIQGLNKEIEKLKSGQADPEVIKTMQATIDTLTAEVEGYKAEAQTAKLDTFKNAEISKYEGNVIPELITGTTEEEIAESVKASNAKYLEIASKFGGAQAGAQAGAKPQAGAQVGASQLHMGGALAQLGATPANPAIAGAGFNNAVVTNEMIRKMSREQYAEYRKSIGLR